MNRNVCEMFIDKCNVSDYNKSMRPIIHHLDNLCSQLKFQKQHPTIKMSFNYELNNSNDIIIDNNIIEEYFRKNTSKTDNNWKNIYV